jgi:4-hydroxybenzoate polyprenyltransferase
LKNKIFAYLQLMRAPNLFTSIADVMAGYLIIVGSASFKELAALLASSACIYGAGCVLNDYHDRELDGRERPFRPIPSGRVSGREAVGLTFALFIMALLFAGMAGLYSLIVAAILILSVINYDLAVKDTSYLGPGNMALCRALNLLLGMSPALVSLGSNLIFPIISFIYVFALTVLSKFETKETIGPKGYLVFAGYLVVIMTMSVMIFISALKIQSIVFLILFIIFTMPRLASGLFAPASNKLELALKYLILGIPLLDAVYVSGTRGWEYGIPVVLCMPVSMILARFFYVT